jgi:hypothetical protein
MQHHELENFVRKSLLLKALLVAALPLYATEDETAGAAPADGTPVDTGEGDAAAAAPVVQTPTPVAQPGDASDPVLETVKTPAHTVADEIQAEIQKLEQLPAEVAAWFESKFVELASHIKALL